MSARRDSGFTLLELLVVLAVLSLVLAIGVPRLLTALPGAASRGTATDLAATLKDARFQAIRHNIDTAVVLDLERRRYGVQGDRQEHGLPAGLQVSATLAGEAQDDGAAGRISFYPDGSSSGGRIRLRQGGHAYWVDVDWLTGRVSVARK